MNYYLNVREGKIVSASNGVSQKENTKSYEVSKDVYYDYLRYENKYTYKRGKIAINKDYANTLETNRKAVFESQFFNTSLGYVRRNVTMKDGSIKDFLTDILPLLQAGVPILTYAAPDFSTDNEPTQNKVIVTDDFINECKQQLLIDFYGASINEDTTDTTDTVSYEVETEGSSTETTQSDN